MSRSPGYKSSRGNEDPNLMQMAKLGLNGITNRRSARVKRPIIAIAARLIALATCLAALACAPENTPDACRITPVAEIPLRIRGGRPLVTAQVDGKALTLLLDTGASGVVISDTVVERLGLPLDQTKLINSTTLGAQTLSWPTRPVSLQFGSLTLEPIAMFVGHFPSLESGTNGVDGLLGGAALKNYDVEIDMPHRRLALFKQRRCWAGPSPLPDPSVTLRIPPPGPYNRVLIPVRLGGADMMALLDTGASMTMADAALLGLVAPEAGGDPVLHVNTASTTAVDFRIHRFDRVEIGGHVYQGASILVGPVRQTGSDMILGADYVRRHPVWISYAGMAVTIQAP